jgi:hypothetical protein
MMAGGIFGISSSSGSDDGNDKNTATGRERRMK